MSDVAPSLPESVWTEETRGAVWRAEMPPQRGLWLYALWVTCSVNAFTAFWCCGVYWMTRDVARPGAALWVVVPSVALLAMDAWLTHAALVMLLNRTVLSVTRDAPGTFEVRRGPIWQRGRCRRLLTEVAGFGVRRCRNASLRVGWDVEVRTRDGAARRLLYVCRSEEFATAIASRLENAVRIARGG
jgi:hypothetical protein